MANLMITAHLHSFKLKPTLKQLQKSFENNEKGTRFDTRCEVVDFRLALTGYCTTTINHH